MNEFTRDNPFVFEGVKVWRDECDICHEGVSGRIYTPWTRAAALHAFIEAERDSWHYTNDDHTEARKGRWRVFFTGQTWLLRHDDFESSEVAEGYSGSFAFLRDASQVLPDFLAWHAAQNQPSEPTGLGAVVEVNGRRYTRVPWHDEDGKPWVQGGDCWNWSQFASRAPVTVLSPGVDA